MNYTIYALKDNATAQLDSNIGASTLSIILKAGQGALFPQPYSSTASSTGSSTLLNKTGIGASGIVAGDYIENITDGSHAYVTATATDSLSTTELQGGSDNTWQSGDTYRVNSFIATLTKVNALTGAVTAYEKVKIIGRSTDALTVDPSGRGFDDSVARSFDADDYLSIYVLTKTSQEFRKGLADVSQQLDLKASIIYVQASLAARSWKQTVRVATTTAGTLATDFENGDTIDGVVLATGDRILIKNQATQSQNGIYVVSVSGAPTRATDFDSPSEVTGSAVTVSSGGSNADTVWVCTSDAPVIGVDNVVFAQVGVSLNKASSTEAKLGKDDSKYMTPLQTAYATNKRPMTATENINALTPVKLVDSSGAKISKATTAIAADVLSAYANFGISETNSAQVLDPNSGKIVRIMRNSTTSVQYQIGTIAYDGTITWTSAANVAAVNTNVYYLRLTYDAQNREFVALYGTATNGYAVVGTISADYTSITWGTPVSYVASASNYFDLCYIGSGKVFILYLDSTTYYAIIGTVGTNTITFGSPVLVNSGGGNWCACDYDSNADRVLMVLATSTGVKAHVASISGTVPTIGTVVTAYASASSATIDVKYDPSSLCMLIAHENSSNLNQFFTAGKINNLTISFGSTTSNIGAASATTRDRSLGYDPIVNKMIQVFAITNKAQYITATINPSTYAVTTDAVQTIDGSFESYWPDITFVPSLGINIISYALSSGQARVHNLKTVGSRYYASIVDGFTLEAVTTGNQALTGLLFSIISGFTSKTTGATAYLWADGTINGVGATEQKIGKFVSDTELLIARSL